MTACINCSVEFQQVTPDGFCSRCESIVGLFDRTPWPWQRRGLLETISRLEAGQAYPFCVTGVTGSGKSQQMISLLRYAVARGLKVAFFINRNLLYQQTINILDVAGIDYGCRGAAFEGMQNDSAPVQICSVPTEGQRVFKKRDKAVDDKLMVAKAAKEHWKLADADIVIVDEIHMNTGATMGRIVSEYLEEGAQVVFYTATPLGINHLCNELVISGTKKECFAEKALVPAIVYGSPELDMRKAKMNQDGEFSEKVKRQIWSNAIFGYILQEWKRVNPDARMALGFGPDVAGSVWLAEHFYNPGEYFTQHQNAIKFLELGREWQIAAASAFYKHGVSAAHIDGNNVWCDGHEYKGDKEARKDVLARWEANEIKIMWNRWVLREGLDFPSLYHAILAAPIGKVSTYDQIVGRVMRYSPETPDAVVITDHAGNYFRCGSPNHDRNWQELFDLPPRAATDMRMDGMAEGKIKQPIICKKCGAYRVSGPKCWQCGHESSMTSRLVLQKDGSLREVNTNGLRPRQTLKKANTQQLWDQLYWGANRAHRKLEKEVAGLQTKADAGDVLAAEKLKLKAETLEKKLNRAMTFNQLYARFFLDNGYFPPKDLANMPKNDVTWFRKCRDTGPHDVRMPPQPEVVEAGPESKASHEPVKQVVQSTLFGE